MYEKIKHGDLNLYIERMLNGDIAAKETLSKHYINLLTDYIDKNFPNYYDKDELLSESLVVLARVINGYDETATAPLTSRILNNLQYYCSKVIKDQKNDFIILEQEEIDNSLESNLEYKEKLEYVMSKINKLDARKKDIIIKHFLEDYTFAELANIYSVKRNTIFELLRSSKRKVRVLSKQYDKYK